MQASGGWRIGLKRNLASQERRMLALILHFIIRWILVDARAEDAWEQFGRSGQRRAHALVLSGHGLRVSFSDREKLSEIGVYDGIVFHLKAIEDDEEPPPAAKHGH